MHRVVIVGCGFAGLFAAKALRHVQVEVVVVDVDVEDRTRVLKSRDTERAQPKGHFEKAGAR